MASTNKTPNLMLPQYISTDHPTWLQDTNDAYEKIDTFAGNVKAYEQQNNADINALREKDVDLQNSIDNLEATDEALNGKITKNQNDIASLQQTVTKHTTDLKELEEDTSALETRVDDLNTTTEELSEKVDLNTTNINGVKDQLTPSNSDWVAGANNTVFGTRPIAPVEVFFKSLNGALVITYVPPYDTVEQLKLYKFNEIRSNSFSLYNINSTADLALIHNNVIDAINDITGGEENILDGLKENGTTNPIINDLTCYQITYIPSATPPTFDGLWAVKVINLVASITNVITRFYMGAV